MNPTAQRLELAVRIATAKALNKAADEIYAQSQIEVPKSGTARSTERFGRTLAEAGEYPGNNPALAATPYTVQGRNPLGQFEAGTDDYLVAEVRYDHPYAVSQHEGKMVYDRGGKEVDWQAHNYTAGGTKSHYLSDPMKAVAATLEGQVALEIQKELLTVKLQP